MKVLDLAIVSDNKKFRHRANFLAQDFHFDYKAYSTVDNFFCDETYKLVTCVLLDCSFCKTSDDVLELTRDAKKVAKESYLIIVVGSMFTADTSNAVKEAGASLVLLENEFFSSSKTEFVLSQTIRSAFIPVKTCDLIEGTKVSFPLYHLMPANSRFLKVIKPGMKVRKDFLERYEPIGELYLRRESFNAWVKYSTNLAKEDELSVARLCRLRFLQLNHSFTILTLLIGDQSSGTSFNKGRQLYENVRELCGELLTALKGISDPWTIVNNSSIGDFGSLERAPAIAAYAGLLSLQAKIGDPEEVMIGALLADIGYLDLSPSTTFKIRNNDIQGLNAEELMEYRKHPIFSLNQCLNRKLPLSDSIKSIILQSHERTDQTGFPHKVRADKIAEEAMLVRLCWELDSKSQIRFGAIRAEIATLKEDLAHSAMKEKGNYSPEFLSKTLGVLQPRNSPIFS
ncbi:HD domain-containing phosphohydrolase [Bdellovibrio reynosensis]|uniref:HD-GYP domain-containing protein n=1 Tax=Bdellovibrio reynosensis TaxID=2835041 RepID=A0ABY4C9S8_9BACT|nr:HD domain-containing phosphohydrolase [Bdellovibrio reynosensis]UOF00436.1 hypothetical protein MNR06_12080 [Bdellovibrio reynosensis]